MDSLDKLLNDPGVGSEHMHSLYWIAAYLCLRYPLQRMLDLCPLLIERCKLMAVSRESTMEGLQICLVVLRAFPTLMSTVAPLILTWTTTYKANPEFMAIASKATKVIVEINVALGSPIYHRPSSIINDIL